MGCTFKFGWFCDILILVFKHNMYICLFNREDSNAVELYLLDTSNCIEYLFETKCDEGMTKSREYAWGIKKYCSYLFYLLVCDRNRISNKNDQCWVTGEFETFVLYWNPGYQLGPFRIPRGQKAEILVVSVVMDFLQVSFLKFHKS